ncbi:hypothetical protein SUDANB95_01700 [Actinosynnema sp. ALI-1.44]
MSVRVSESIIAVLLFALVVPLVALPWVAWQYRRVGRLRGWSAFVAAAGILYGCGLVAFTLFPLPTITPDFCGDRALHDYWQTTPFESLDDIARDGRAALAQVLLNVVLFVPLGFLLRYRFAQGLAAATLIGLATSLAVETIQGTAVLGLYPCPYRLADVDDLMTNTAGTVVGWLVARAVHRALPRAVPDPVADLDPPGLARRGFAFAGDLLVIWLVQGAIRVTVGLAGSLDVATSRWFGVVVVVFVVGVCTLAVPLARADRATPGQIAFHLAVEGDRTAVLRRFAVWWLPVLALLAFDRADLVLLLAAVVGIAARLRHDRRSLVGLASRTRTTTRSAHTGTDRVTV